MKHRNIALAIIAILLAAAVVTATVIYLVTDKTVPGLIPFCSAALMIPMWLQQKQSKAVRFTFLAAFVLNVIAGCMQIIAAFLP